MDARVRGREGGGEGDRGGVGGRQRSRLESSCCARTAKRVNVWAVVNSKGTTTTNFDNGGEKKYINKSVKVFYC